MTLPELIGWAVLIGGIPTSAYYMTLYGKRLFARRKELSNAVSDRAARRLQWQQEILFSFNCSLLAGVGFLLCHWLKTAPGVQ